MYLDTSVLLLHYFDNQEDFIYPKQTEALAEEQWRLSMSGEIPSSLGFSSSDMPCLSSGQKINSWWSMQS